MSIESVQKAIDFIEEHLRDEVSISQVADAAKFSLFHFCRLFNQVARHSPYDYLIRRRLSEAARELIQTKRRIIDIAIDYRFNSPETFSRAFKRMFTTQPYEWRRGNLVFTNRLLPPFTPEYLEHIRAQGRRIYPTLTNLKAISLTGLMTLLPQGQEVPPQDFFRLISTELGCGPARSLYGAAYPTQGGIFYLAAARIETATREYMGAVQKEVPAGTYARFLHLGGLEKVNLTLNYIRHTWLPLTREEEKPSFEVEVYPALNDPEKEIEIYIPLSQ